MLETGSNPLGILEKRRNILDKSSTLKYPPPQAQKNRDQGKRGQKKTKHRRRTTFKYIVSNEGKNV